MDATATAEAVQGRQAQPRQLAEGNLSGEGGLLQRCQQVVVLAECCDFA